MEVATHPLPTPPCPSASRIPIFQLLRPRPFCWAGRKNRKQSVLLRVRKPGPGLPAPSLASEVNFHLSAQPTGLRSGLPQVLVRPRRRARPGEASDQRVAAVGTTRPRPPIAAAFPQSPAPLRSCLWLVPNSLNRELWAGSRSRRESKVELESHSYI